MYEVDVEVILTWFHKIRFMFMFYVRISFEMQRAICRNQQFFSKPTCTWRQRWCESWQPKTRVMHCCADAVCEMLHLAVFAEHRQQL